MVKIIVGERIRKSRLEKNLSQFELGKMIGVTKVSISGYERINRTPKIDKLIKLADALDVSIDYLLGRDINVITEKDDPYVIKLAKEDIKIIGELKNHTELYNKLMSEPSRTIELIVRKIGRM